MLIPTPTLAKQLNSLSTLHLLAVIALLRALETPVLGKMIVKVLQ